MNPRCARSPTPKNLQPIYLLLWIVMGLLLLPAGCGEPMFDNAGSQHSLLEDREACAMEME